VTTPADDRRTAAPEPGGPRRVVRRLAPVLAIAALIALAYGFGLHRDVSFETLIRNRASIDRFIADHAVAAVAAYIALYVAVISLSLPGGAIMTVTGGFLFGTLVGGVAAVAGALAGATVIFLIARSAFGECLTRRAGPFVAKLASGFRADAFSYLLFLRLVPFPFWLVNLAPALFDVKLLTFVAATAIGILPATVTFAMFGAGLGSVMAAQEAQYNACLAAGHGGCSVDFDLSHVLTPTLLCALAALGVLALVPVLARRFFGRKLDAGIPSKRL
jgi:uncharacterized membrane protein YdjX (TVP38/TMEM64 family)